jgi:hypothetical protein
LFILKGVFRRDLTKTMKISGRTDPQLLFFMAGKWYDLDSPICLGYDSIRLKGERHCAGTVKSAEGAKAVDWFHFAKYFISFRPIGCSSEAQENR